MVPEHPNQHKIPTASNNPQITLAMQTAFQNLHKVCNRQGFRECIIRKLQKNLELPQ
jgi:hypothetical protein